MSMRTARQAIDLFSEYRPKEPHIHFIGGEPFLQYERMQKIVAYGCEKLGSNGARPVFHVTTNGTLLNQRRLVYCRQNDIELQFSLDGPREVNALGRSAASYALVMRNIDLLRRWPDYPVKVKAVITPENFRHLPQTLSYFRRMPFAEVDLSYQLDREWLPEDLSRLKQIVGKMEASIRKRKNEGGARMNGFRPQRASLSVFQCAAGKEGIAVTPTGDVYGCAMLFPWSRQAAERGTADQFRQFCLGQVATLTRKALTRRRKKVIQNPLLSGQYSRETEREKCRSCQYIWYCGICPGIILIHGINRASVPPFICQIRKTTCGAGRRS